MIAEDQKTYIKYGQTNRGSMLPSLPYSGNIAKMNNSKALTSRLYPVNQDTLHALGIINKAGRKRVFKDRSHRRYLYEGTHEVPVFNLKHQNEPVMMSFKFAAYRTSIKIYIMAKLLP